MSKYLVKISTNKLLLLSTLIKYNLQKTTTPKPTPSVHPRENCSAFTITLQLKQQQQPLMMQDQHKIAEGKVLYFASHQDTRKRRKNMAAYICVWPLTSSS